MCGKKSRRPCLAALSLSKLREKLTPVDATATSCGDFWFVSHSLQTRSEVAAQRYRLAADTALVNPACVDHKPILSATFGAWHVHLNTLTASSRLCCVFLSWSGCVCTPYVVRIAFCVFLWSSVLNHDDGVDPFRRWHVIISKEYSLSPHSVHRVKNVPHQQSVTCLLLSAERRACGAEVLVSRETEQTSGNKLSVRSKSTVEHGKIHISNVVHVSPRSGADVGRLLSTVAECGLWPRLVLQIKHRVHLFYGISNRPFLRSFLRCAGGMDFKLLSLKPSSSMTHDNGNGMG